MSLAWFQVLTGGVRILDAEITYTVESAYQMLSDMGQKGREAYLRTLLTLVPTLALGSGYGENALIVSLLL